MGSEIIKGDFDDFEENSSVPLTDTSVQQLLKKAAVFTSSQAATNIAGVNSDLYKNGIIYALANSKKSKKTGKSARDCTPASIAMCWLASVQLQLPFDTRGLIYLVPYGKEAAISVSYKGLIVLAKRSNPDILNIEAIPVGKDVAAEVKIIKTATSDNYELPVKITGNQYKYDDIVGCLSVIHYRGGQSRVMFVPKSDIDLMKKSSKFGTLWNNWPMEMVKKSTIKRHLKIEALPDVQLAIDKEEAMAAALDNVKDAERAEMPKKESIAEITKRKALEDLKKEKEQKEQKIKEAEQVDNQDDATEQQQSEQAEAVADKPVEESWLSKHCKCIDAHANELDFLEKLLERYNALPAKSERYSEDDRKKAIDKVQALIKARQTGTAKQAIAKEKEGMF